MPFVFLALAIVWFLLALNTVVPPRRPALLGTIAFFAGWLVGELAIHHVVAQLFVSAALVSRGAARGPAGVVALGLAIASWVILLRGYFAARDTEARVDRAIRDTFGERYEDDLSDETQVSLGGHADWGRILAPFPVRHHDVVCARNLVYHQEGRLRLRLDVYRRRDVPAPDGKPAPAVLYVHGGAWILGRKDEQGLPLLQQLASMGFTCFTIDYRLSPRATFPDHLEDVKRAIRWVRDHAREHGADPSFLILCGNSAGGHLASLAALTANEPRYQPGFETADTTVEGCVSFYGVYDLADRHGSYAHRGLLELIEKHVMKSKLADAREGWDAASPIARVHAGAPPFLLVHGDLDTLVPIEQARHFAAAFREVAPDRLAFAELPGAQHAFEVFPSLRAELCVRGVARFCALLHARHLARRDQPASDAPASPATDGAIAETSV